MWRVRRRLPASLPPAAVELVAWLDAQDAVPLAAELVHGAEEGERRRLAGLGAFARVLAGRVEGWPEELVEWASAHRPDPPDALVHRVRAALADTREDILARVYEAVVSGVHRRRLGTFFTPDAVVVHMLGWVADVMGEPDHVVDPGAGVGAFALAALQRWPAARVSAVDVNAVTLGLLAARTAARGRADGGHGGLRLVPGDFLQWLVDGWPDLRGRRLVMGNPPYTRHQLMTEKDKKDARVAAGPLITSGLAGLSTYFLAATINALGSDDALCLLLPSSWCETRYGRELRQWLWAARHRRVELHKFPSRLAIFPGTQVMAVVLLVGPQQTDWQAMAVREVDLDDGLVVERSRVEIIRDGSCPATFSDQLGSTSPASPDAAVPLAEHVDVRRGLVTGARTWFFLSQRKIDERGLPAAALRRALVRPSHFTAAVLDKTAHDDLLEWGYPGWLLDLNNYDMTDPDDRLRDYLDELTCAGVRLGVLVGRREPWYVVERVADPDLLFVPVGYGQHRIIENRAAVIGSNNFYGLTMREGAPWSAAALAGWLRSAPGQEALRSVSRHYQGGSLKIEPGALRSVLVPLDLREGALQ